MWPGGGIFLFFIFILMNEDIWVTEKCNRSLPFGSFLNEVLTQRAFQLKQIDYQSKYTFKDQGKHYHIYMRA